jgi:drug/metabolite transporter (DMT)-like permease
VTERQVDGSAGAAAGALPEIARNGLAAAMIVSGMAIIALVDNSVRLVTSELGLWQYQAMRAGMCMAALLAVAVALGWRLRPVNPARVALRAAIASLGIVLYFGALAVMTIGQAGAGLYTAPVFVLVISVLAFGLRAGWLRSLAVALGFAGVLIVLRPWGDTTGGGALPLWAAAVAVAAGLLHGTGAVLTREYCAGEPIAGMVLAHFGAMTLWGLGGMAAVALLVPEAAAGPAGWFARAAVWPSGPALFWTAVNAAGSVVAMMLAIRAYQIAEASRVAVLEYSFLPFAAIWALVLFGDVPDLATLAGTALIVGAGAMIMLRPGVR